MQVKKTSHSIYNINYHIVFCPKYRHSIFKDELETELLKILQVTCYNYGFELIEKEIIQGHVHLFVSAPPTIAPTEIVKILKSVSAYWIFKAFPNLKKSKFWGYIYNIYVVHIRNAKGKWLVEQRLLCWDCWCSKF